MALGSRPTSSRIIASSARSGVAKSVPTMAWASSAREAALPVDALQDGALAGLVRPQLPHLQLRWASKSSCCDRTEMYSPTAIEKAPASRPAMPAMTMAWLSEEAPATPMTRARLETRPSLPPKTAGRRKPVARVSWGEVGGGGMGFMTRSRAMRSMSAMMPQPRAAAETRRAAVGRIVRPPARRPPRTGWRRGRGRSRARP